MSHPSTGPKPRPTPLETELAELITQSLPPESVPDDTRERIRQKLLSRIAADSTHLHVTMPLSEQDWKPIGEGLSMKVLHERDGILSYLVRLAPGAELPAHRHPVDEECVVLEGEVSIGTLCLKPGGYHLGRKDVLHDRLRSPSGALIFLRGAVPARRLAV